MLLFIYHFRAINWFNCFYDPVKQWFDPSIIIGNRVLGYRERSFDIKFTKQGFENACYIARLGLLEADPGILVIKR